MARTIIRVHESANGPDRFFLEAPLGYDGARVGHELTCDPQQPPFAPLEGVDPIAHAGKRLYAELCKHPAVAKALTAALGATADRREPIAIFAESPNADRLPWETLYDDQKSFLALDARWPILRLREAYLPEVRIEYQLEPPLRLLCVLSAAGANDAQRAPGRDEWQALIDELAQASAEPNALPVDLRVLVGEADLKARIDADAAAPPAGVSITCEFITNKDKVLNTVSTFAPHLLHFFCHGSLEGAPHLRIGTREDWLLQQEGSVRIAASELPDPSQEKQQVWLVTLNCCDSAAQAADARVLAASLVHVGFPAALGMREPLDTKSAHAFTRQYYRAILRALAALPEQDSSDVEWAGLLLPARRDLATANGGLLELQARGVREWTIPAVYVRLQPFRLRRQPPISPVRRALLQQQEVIRQQAEQVRALDLPDATKQGILAEFQARLDAIDAQLNPAVAARAAGGTTP